MSQTQVECAICMDDIHFNESNFIKTECGHCFHASCLMRNVAHNGFGCPYCRSAMAEVVADSDDEDESTAIEEDIYDDYALRGLRFFINNLEGNQHDREDELEEREDEEEGEEEQEEEVEIVKPDASFITQKLVEQGVTMESLLKILLLQHEEYEAEEVEFELVDEDVWSKMRTIISNYQPVINEPVVIQTLPESVDNEAQPKLHHNITVRRPMMHI